MRVTSQMMSDNAVKYMQDNLERMGRLQQQAASGKKILFPSDDPALTVSNLSLRSTLRKHEAYLETARVTREWLNANEIAFEQWDNMLMRAVTLVEEGISDVNGADERAVMGTEMEGILEQAVQVGNATHRGSFLFAGYKTTPNSITAPNTNQMPWQMTPAPPGALPTVVTYGGDAGVIQNAIEPTQQIPINLHGQQVVNGEPLLQRLFDRLLAARDALNAAPKDLPALTTALADLKTSFDNLKDFRTANGARVRQVDDSIARMEQTDLALKNLLSHQEDVNMAETVSQLKLQETAYQTVLQVGARALPPSLFDFLR